MLKKLLKQQQGGIVLEAALILPLFLSFVVGLIVLIQVAMMEMALQSAVSEATKTIATQLYPVRLLVQEAKAKVEQSAAAGAVQNIWDQVQSARSKVVDAESLADDYAAYIPDSILEIVKWEKEKREQGEGKAAEEWEHIYEETLKPQINAAFTPVVYAFCDSDKIKKDSFKVVDVVLPSMEAGGDAYFGVEAQVEFKLALPFLSRTIVLKKKAYERSWVGA